MTNPSPYPQTDNSNDIAFTSATIAHYYWPLVVIFVILINRLLLRLKSSTFSQTICGDSRPPKGSKRFNMRLYPL